MTTTTTTPATTKALLTADDPGTRWGPRLVAASAILYAFVAAVAAHARARVASPDSPAAAFERSAR